MTDHLENRCAFLGMPSYGLISFSAGAGFWNSSRWPNSVIKKYTEGSLLCQNFNSLWCTALNMQRKGRQIDYFAMQHGDVEPERNWLDTLIDELETHDLDIIGAAVPIKDTRGLTSIALHKEGDNWNPLCRLSIDEVQRLPMTFTSEDVGHKILLNTGLWVCRFDPAWRTKVWFDDPNRIVLDERTDSYRAQVESEDWFFSRLLHELGLAIGATSKIALMHRGDMLFGMDRTWGTKHDESVAESQVKQQQSGLRFPYDVPGWLTRAEGEKLYEHAAGKRVLEIGSFCGRSTICLAQSAAEVVSVDPHDGRCLTKPRDTWHEFSHNLAHYGVRQTVHPFRACVREIAHELERPFDLVFIDGAHDYESVVSDIEVARSLLAPGGLIAFHDYQSMVDPDVTRAVNELLAAGGELLSHTHLLAVARPPALNPLEV